MAEVYRTINHITSLGITTKYQRTDIDLISSTYPVNNFSLEKRHTLTTGQGDDDANILWHDRRTLNGRELLQLDAQGLVDVFGSSLDFAAVKVLYIENLNTNATANLFVNFKSEQYNIGPRGCRYVYEPLSAGIETTASSTSGTEGSLVIISTESITYDIYLLGSNEEQ